MSGGQRGAVHTAGSWHTGIGKAARIVYAPDGWAVADAVVSHGRHGDVEVSKANAARIVACVNACEGIDTGALSAQAKCGGMRAVVEAGHRSAADAAELRALLVEARGALAGIAPYVEDYLREGNLKDLEPEFKHARSQFYKAVDAAKLEGVGK